MATSGQIRVYVTAFDDLIFDWTRTSVSEVNNTSTITWKLLLRSTESGDISSSVSKDWAVHINGTVYEGTNSVAISNNTTKTLASGTTTIAHNYDGTKSFSVWFSQEFAITFAGKYIGTISKTASITLDPIQRRANIISAANFTDEGNPSFTYTPIQGVKQLLCNVSWGGIAYISNRVIPTSGSSYTFTLTNEERETLRNAMATVTTKTVTYTLVTVFNDGSTNTSSKNATASIVNALPGITSFSIIDDADATTDITGNPYMLVRYKSTAKATCVATAKKGASVVSVVWKNGSQTKTGADVIFYGVESGKFVIEITDSRGITSYTTITKEIIDYFPVTCNLGNVEASAGGNISFSVSGEFFNAMIGNSANYATIGYRIYEKGTTPPRVTFFTPEQSGHTFSAFVNVEGLDYQKTYTLDVYASDLLASSRTLSMDVNVLPLFDWGKDDFQFNVPVNFGAGATIGGKAIGVSSAGTWTPTLSSDAAVTSYEVQEGWWQRVGNVVTIGWQIKANCKSGYHTAALSVMGVPFAPSVAAFGGGIAFNIYIAAGMCFAGWSISTLGLVTARLQPCNNTTAGNLNISSTSGFPNGGGSITLAGTICYTTDE